jgi:hypothetical protein
VHAGRGRDAAAAPKAAAARTAALRRRQPAGAAHRPGAGKEPPGRTSAAVARAGPVGTRTGVASRSPAHPSRAATTDHHWTRRSPAASSTAPCARS